jgi:hypothetical protein
MYPSMDLKNEILILNKPEMAKICNQLIVMMMMEGFIDTILKIMKKN